MLSSLAPLRKLIKDASNNNGAEAFYALIWHATHDEMPTKMKSTFRALHHYVTLFYDTIILFFVPLYYSQANKIICYLSVS